MRNLTTDDAKWGFALTRLTWNETQSLKKRLALGVRPASDNAKWDFTMSMVDGLRGCLARTLAPPVGR
jgi:hypothetical protein